MRCEDVRQQLDDYVDAALAAEDRAIVEAHVVACADCAAELAALRKLIQVAHELPAGIAPRRDLWPDLERRLETHEQGRAPALDHAAARGRAPAQSRTVTPRRGIWMPAYGLAAAAVLALAVGLWLWTQGDRGLTSDTERLVQTEQRPAFASGEIVPAVAAALERECAGAGKMLQASVAGRNTASGAVMASSLASGLDDLDRSIAETLAALEQAPDDPTLVKLLTVRYQQKLALLQSAMAFVEEV